MQPSDVFVLTPAGQTDPSVAIAAGRAGARGTLDLEFAPADRVADAVRRLARHTGGRFGVRVRAIGDLRDLRLSEPERQRGACEEPRWRSGSDGSGSDGTRPAWVILIDPAGVNEARAAGVETFVEAVTLAEAVAAADAGADGVILKGHEAGGRVGPDTAFVLVQKWIRWAAGRQDAPPFWVWGGIGPNTAAACRAAGARGVVLDSQLLLARESPLSDDLRARVAGCDGGETLVVGGYRVYARPDSPAAMELAKGDRFDPTAVTADPTTGVWPVGQDVALAAGLAATGGTVAGIVQRICQRAEQQLATAARLKPLAEGSALAVAHGTPYPILQGPMTRVSDTAGFAKAVADGGGLPFLALALSRRPEVEKLLAETKRTIGGRPWGVGILGFVPPELRDEQLAAVRAVQPPFAVIAGGRPDQAKALEADGTRTYLHVPSPGLLRMFLKDGGRRFVFEGRECGGHVGPRSSFALWESMIAVLDEHLATHPKDELDIAFAGGVHDRLSAAMVSALAAGLAEKGVRIGAWLGTAYLFTTEAVETGAITAGFQHEALACGDTVLLETGPGHAVRVVPTPYADVFEAEKQRLRSEGKSPLEVGLALERMNLGRLRLASKGVDRAGTEADKGTRGHGDTGTRGHGGLVAVPEAEQRQRGMYMIGQVAALRDAVTTIPALHADVCEGASTVLDSVPLSPCPLVPLSAPEPPPPCDVAIIGLSCFYPKAGGLHPYWHNILAKANAVIEIPASHWDWKLYYDPDPKARDKMISKWGGFMDDVVFEPLRFGITPKSIPNIEPLQLLLLEAVRQAIADAGYENRPFERERAAAILGVGGGGMPLSVAYGFRACMPLLDTIPNVPIKSSQIVELGDGILPEWTEDSFPGILLNVAAGRVANRFNLGGPNMAIDAACGSSLAALYAGVRELTTGTSDLAVVMGADAVQTPYAYVAFSKTHALSPKGRCRPFDAAADGIALAEGVGVAVLKRLADAERDGDRIYAVVKGVGASSDGRDKGLTAPRAEGQLRALHRAYAQARVSPARVGLVEAHGTGTVVGDQTEARALGQVFRDAGGAPRSVALGSVKSMIGHSKCAAGLAGLIKAAFALHHKVLPPTLAETPNPKANLDGGPLYLNTDARPWVHGADHPRTAGVSAFGFGGTNFHAVLEEHTGDYLNRPEAGLRTWPAELFVWRRADVSTLTADVTPVRDALAAGGRPVLAELAASVWKSSRAAGPVTLAVVAGSLDELAERLTTALDALPKGPTFADPRGIYFAAKPEPGKLAFLFPGQGSQYPDMLSQTALTFPEVRQAFDDAERTLLGELEQPLGRFVFPPSPFGPDQEAANRQALQRTEVAQPAVGAASLGMCRLLAALGVEPDLLAGHSYGEYAALAAAGAMTAAELARLSHRRGQAIRDAAGPRAGGMIAADADAATVETALAGLAEVWPANHNSPRQTVVAGSEAGLTAALEKLHAAGVRAQRIPVACGFHSPLVAGAREPLAAALKQVTFAVPRKPVFSNATAAPHADAGFAERLADHLVSPVRFADEIQAMHAAGARVFVEVGPQAVLTGLVGQILNGQPHLAAASDVKGRPGLTQLAHLLGQLLAAGVPVRLDRLFDGRGLKPFDVKSLNANTGPAAPPATAWVVNGVRSRPIHGPEPRLLGQTHNLPVDVRASGGRQSPEPAPLANPSIASNGPLGAKTQGADALRSPGRHPPSPVAEQTPMTHPDGVMLRFQDVMAKFLDTQRAVMLGYLGHADAAAVPPPSVNGHHPQLNGHVKPAPVMAAPAPIAERMNPPLPVPVEPAPAAPVTLDRAALLARLLDLVSERTGYPKESLSIDLDLEADLGIDSIKRVEILGTLADGLGLASGNGGGPTLEMEKLSVLKTLRGIADHVSDALAGPTAESPAPAPPPAVAPHPGARQGEVQRLVVRLIDAPLPARPRFAPPAGTIVITDDQQGTARELADRLAEFDVTTALVNPADADLGDPAAVAELLDRLRADGPIAGLIHLLPLAEPADEPTADRTRREVKGLYLLARGLEPDLTAAAEQGGAVLLAVTAMGGRMGFGGDLPDPFYPGHGGVAGFVKCLGHEWPGVTVRVVDVDRDSSAAHIAEALLSELGDPDGPFEVGRDGDRRLTWEVEPGPLDTDEPAVQLAAGDTVLVTGGARGITARIALELAERVKPRLVLVGSSPPPTDEPAETVGLSSPAEIKAALMKRMPGARPAAVETEYRRLRKDREMRANLDAIRAAGATVEYHAIDVRDAEAFGRLLDELNQSGGIAAVVHGAGVIDDKLLRDKTPESFDRVFGTKVDSARLLAEKLDPRRLKVFALFASITSRYGNRGQSDYAAANEVLSKLACDLDRRWPGRVVSVAWGPWAEVGMVADLEKHLVARGLKLIDPAVGARLCVDELLYGTKGEPEVLIAGGTESPARPTRVEEPLAVGAE